ncbi:NACHT, LRR and PYD domains-containing protein 1 homolog [Engraulis encrasicolus]|uniref:NACHT, LRR and PYD domains-containing protein 1 homolog n=1 Tax=Engraulis encrasicolus TaxID=184585 RepID=UPI002FD43F59
MVSGLKAWIYSQYEVVQEYNALPGEEVLLTDRYTQLLIIEKHRQQEEREKEIRISGPGFFGARSSENRSITVDQFFRPKDNGRVPRAVILQGNSGHGKSFTVQKIILDWASGRLYQDQFALVLHLTCKELNLLYKDGVQKSVVDLLSFSETFTPLILKKLKDLPQKVLLLIDGFDELQFPVCEISKSPVKDLSTPAPVEAILGALLKGSILSECFLLVTTRPTASDTLSNLLKHPVRSIEILGFSEEGVHEYIKRFCKDDEVWKNVSNRVMANETLFTSCFIPVICWIVCTVFRDHLQKNVEMTNSLKTTTSIFVKFVSILLKHHCRGLRQPVAALLRSLGQLAETGIQKQQVLFSKGVVFNTVSDPASVPFLCKFLLKETVDMVEMFSFMHLSFQEFFSALHYISGEDEEKAKDLFIGIEQHESRSHLLPVIQFLFGLSHVKVTQDLKELGVTPNPCVGEQLKEWAMKLIHNNRDRNDMMLFTLHCLYELHDKEFVKRAMEVWGEVKFDAIPLTRADCWVLLYCLQCCPTIPKIHLENCNITPDKLKMLQPELNRCQELWLDVESLSDADVYDLVSAMGEGKTLSQLRVWNCSLSDESVQQILTAASKQKSVDRVVLNVKSITLSMAVNLMRFMRNTQTVERVE